MESEVRRVVCNKRIHYFSPSKYSEEDMEHGTTCSICHEDFIRGYNVKKLECNHVYHADCIDKWLVQGGTSCPNCRKEVTDKWLDEKRIRVITNTLNKLKNKNKN